MPNSSLEEKKKKNDDQSIISPSQSNQEIQSMDKKNEGMNKLSLVGM
jgi:hypothetical protein